VREYEIRIFKDQSSLSLIIEQPHFSDQAAIKAARRMALGKPFEVWRDLECITGFAEPPLQFPLPKPELPAT
jgi:hypothetical protein